MTNLLLAEACRRSYDERPDLPGFRSYPIHWGTTQSFVFVNSTDVICAFRGTQSTSLWDWLTDIKLTRKPLVGANGKFHRGFLNAANTVYSQQLARVRVLGRDRKVWVTGHSLGAGIALSQLALLGARNPGHLLRIERCVTFGAPRMTNKQGAQWLEALPLEILNIQAEGDRICNLPPRWMGYRHVGSLARLPKPSLLSLDDHSMEDSYIPRLKQSATLLCA